MIELQKNYNFLDQSWCNKLLDNQGDQILAYERGSLLFVFNFNPNRSFTDYGFQVTPGKYDIVLDSDDPLFGGVGNIDHSINYYAQRMGGVSGSNWLKLYLPARTALVLRRIPPPSIYKI